MRLRPINQKRAEILGDLLHHALAIKRMETSQWEHTRKADQRAAEKELAEAETAVEVFYERYLPEGEL